VTAAGQTSEPDDPGDPGDPSDATGLAAGNFSAWLVDIDAVLAGVGDAEVPCNGCTACCTASQFIHVGPDDTDARAHIPAELLFPAPGRPAGHDLMGYDEQGRCPMLVDGACSIYEHRPRTCRTYDCRVFPAAGLDPAAGEPHKEAIGQRARRWRFDEATGADRTRHQAVQAAARYLRDRPDLLPDGVTPANTTQLAVLAVEAHGAFLEAAEPEPEVVQVQLRRRARPG